MKTLATILIVLFLTLALTAPFNAAINTRYGIPLFLLFMFFLGTVNILVATVGFEAEYEILPGSPNPDDAR